MSNQMTDITSKPLAAPGFISYRCKQPFGWVMIGARNDEDAMKQAKQSTPNAKIEDLQVWNGTAYVPCKANPIELPPIDAQIKVRVGDEDIDGVVIGHDDKDGKPIVDYLGPHRLSNGDMSEPSTRWAWHDQVRPAERG